MKAAFEAVNHGNNNSFLLRKFDEAAFSAPYHFHPELELTLILKGEGKRFVGSSMSDYKAGDLVLLGSNLPHCWKSDGRRRTGINASSLVVQFAGNFLGDDFFSGPEMRNIEKMFERSRNGILFSGRASDTAADSLLRMNKETSPFRRLILLLELLQALALSRQFEELDKRQRKIVFPEREQSRINEVMSYIVENFRKDISLDKAAKKAGMASTAFCRYFKRHTRKTFIETVMEYRINFAEQQLVGSDKSIANIGFDCGFNDISHFYKTFRTKNRLSPLQYRKKFSDSLV